MRFVVLEHFLESPILPDHYDFLVEREAPMLESWSLSDLPNAVGTVAAVRMQPHRRVYLTYEGPVLSRGGWVRRWDAGHYLAAEWTDQIVRLFVSGSRWVGAVVLKRNGAASGWRFTFQPSKDSPVVG